MTNHDFLSTQAELPPEVSGRTALWRGQLFLAGLLFIACVAGIYSRPLGYTASFWPANAIMLGMLLRRPLLAQAPATWLYALLSFMAADLLTGSSLFITLSLNLANVVGVLCGWAFLARLSPQTLRLQQQGSVLYLLAGCALAALGCTLIGAPAGSVAFNASLGRSVAVWLSTEFYNYILMLPLFLAAPKGWPWEWPPVLPESDAPWHRAIPALSLLLSEALSFWIGGPGSMAFIMPSMVWCAMAYGVFPITILSLVICLWKSAAIAMGAFSFTPENSWEVASFRTGLALLSTAPLAVASAYALRTQTLAKLNYAVSHDFLTGVLARRAFMERGQKLCSRLQAEQQPMAVLMLDIDHFKRVNDQYGHAHGDQVLREFAALARQALRPEDLLGRMGGEEFAILLPRTQAAQALLIGERLCNKLRTYRFQISAGGHMHATLSIGIYAPAEAEPVSSLEQLLNKADQALYRAKHAGRDRVCQYLDPVDARL